MCNCAVLCDCDFYLHIIMTHLFLISLWFCDSVSGLSDVACVEIYICCFFLSPIVSVNKYRSRYWGSHCGWWSPGFKMLNLPSFGIWQCTNITKHFWVRLCCLWVKKGQTIIEFTNLCCPLLWLWFSWTLDLWVSTVGCLQQREIDR